MDEEKVTPNTAPEPDVFEQEERCLRAIRTVRKAVIMRLLVAGLILWTVIRFPVESWVWGLMAFVIIVDLTAMLPLIQEWRKQKKHLQELIDSEET